MDFPEKLKEKLRALPDCPGCYLMRDRHGRIIYVGKAASLRKRVQSYFRRATLTSGTPKLRGLVKSVHDIDLVLAKSEAEAILTEGQLIKDYRPRYNVRFKDDKRFLLLRGETRGPFPRFRLCRIRKEDGSAYFGPFASSSSARATLDFLEKRFGLRKCEPRLPVEETYKHCLNDVIRYCSAPCVGKVSEEEYRQRFGEACAFLRGERLVYLKELEDEMHKTAASLQFERAAVLRDTLFHLRATVRERGRVVSTPEMKREDGRSAVRELQQALALKAPPRRIEAFDVSNISGTFSVASMVSFEDGLPQRNRYRRFRIKTVLQIDDPKMMAEAVRRHYAGLLAESATLPDLVLFDGGLGQLKAARAELVALGLGHVPSVGLAKRFEEIYTSADAPPVRLQGSSLALRLLQRVRDEAHRFALTYHRHLRAKRIRESALDSVAGIGEKKKQLLLDAFGSVARLRRASESDVAAVPGIGPGLARRLRAEIEADDGDGAG